METQEKTEENRDLRKRFSEIRFEKNISGLKTEIQVADALGLKQNNLNKILKTGTNLKVFRQICNMFQIKIEDLFMPASIYPQLQSENSATNEVREIAAEYGKNQPHNQTEVDIMSELQFIKEQNQLLKENNMMQKEKILRLERELKQCQEGNRVGAH